MRNNFAAAFHEAAGQDPRLCLLVADISPAGSIQAFREAYPDRFINTGVAEQVMIGMAAGMAMRGLRPFAYTIAPFALYRPFEMIRVDLAYQNLPVTVVGIGGGVTYSVLGGTHHAQEDVAIACAVPNMAVIAPCDPLETREATKWCAGQERGPVYLRLGKAGEPDLTSQTSEPFVFGKLRFLTKGSDVAVLSYGPILKMGAEIANRFRQEGTSVSLISAHTLKPFDTEGVADLLANCRRVVVIEEMVPHGGLADRVKVLAWERKATCRIDTFTLDDAFHHRYGTHAELLAVHGLELERIWQSLKQDS
ncbi:MAG: transketolase [Alphaproteobacteria bacterium]|nr:transketolase [Alphaproteobacteria bacterium]